MKYFDFKVTERILGQGVVTASTLNFFAINVRERSCVVWARVDPRTSDEGGYTGTR